MMEPTPPKESGIWGWVIATAVMVFVLLRLPMVLFSSGQMDEQWFAVPGYTVWKEGIPRIPYCPTRRRENFFENADRCLFALPPALHYTQAPFFGLFPAGYPTARIPSFLAGIAGIVLLGVFFPRIVGASFQSGMALILFAMSRPMMFTGITARPDLLCCLCCWGAIACMWHWSERVDPSQNSFSWELLVAGILCGLGLLYHPFAIVGCLQCGVWAIARSGTWAQRGSRGLMLTLPAIGMTCLWLPLILRFPYEFESQFTSNVLERSGPGLIQRLLWPWPSLWHHARYQWEYHQPIQFIFLTLGGLLGSIALWRSTEGMKLRPSVRGRFLLLVLSSIYLTATVAGIHPTKGYWVYSSAWMYLLAVVGWTWLMKDCLQRFRFARNTSLPRWGITAWGAILIAMMLPGTGLTTLVAYARDGAGPKTNATLFAQRLLEELPKDTRCIVDVHFVFDVWLSGRDTLLCQPRERFWGDTIPDYDLLIIGREGLDADAPSDYQATLDQSIGEPSTPADCYVKIYTPLGGADL
jgi:hypothetical protein